MLSGIKLFGFTWNFAFTKKKVLPFSEIDVFLVKLSFSTTRKKNFFVLFCFVSFFFPSLCVVRDRIVVIVFLWDFHNFQRLKIGGLFFVFSNYKLFCSWVFWLFSTTKIQNKHQLSNKLCIRWRFRCFVNFFHVPIVFLSFQKQPVEPDLEIPATFVPKIKERRRKIFLTSFKS